MSPSKEPDLYDLTALCATPNATLAGIFLCWKGLDNGRIVAACR
jgi:hypothetical protein